MRRGLKSFPSVAMLCGALALVSTPLLRADGDGAEVHSVQSRSYPRQTADLEKWLRREIIPGQTKSATIEAIFGTCCYLRMASIDRQGHMRLDDSFREYELDDLGIHDHPPHYVLHFEFDAHSGALLRAAVEEEERQTGFNINGETGTAGGP